MFWNRNRKPVQEAPKTLPELIESRLPQASAQEVKEATAQLLQTQCSGTCKGCGLDTKNGRPCALRKVQSFLGV